MKKINKYGIEYLKRLKPQLNTIRKLPIINSYKNPTIKKTIDISIN